jgi:uncharacterized membrane protein YsdA (DUF1294 family)
MLKGATRERPPPRSAGRLGGTAVVVLIALLVLPAVALGQAVGWSHVWMIAVALLVLSGMLFVVYGQDKRWAATGRRRVPESTLHLLALLGGWPGGFVAQRIFRHKTSKRSFQVIFWGIVLVHQCAAVDSILEWRLSRDLVRSARVTSW